MMKRKKLNEYNTEYRKVHCSNSALTSILPYLLYNVAYQPAATDKSCALRKVPIWFKYAHSISGKGSSIQVLDERVLLREGGYM